MISSHVKISMISVISSLSLKLYLSSLVYHRNIFGSSSKVFGNLRTSSDIFGNFRKWSENVRERSSGLRNNFENLRKSPESGRKSSENHQKRRHQHVYIIKRTLHVSSKIWILCSRGKNNISLVRWYCPCHSNIKFISSRHRVISSIDVTDDYTTIVTHDKSTPITTRRHDLVKTHYLNTAFFSNPSLKAIIKGKRGFYLGTVYSIKSRVADRLGAQFNSIGLSFH